MSDRVQIAKEDNNSPGVGDYQISDFKIFSTYKANITKGKRFNENKRDNSPPLTKYKIQSGFDKYVADNIQRKKLEQS